MEHILNQENSLTFFDKQINEIDSLQGANLFSIGNYENFYENSLKNKSEIIDLFGGNKRLVKKIDDIAGLQEQSEREFKEEFKIRVKKDIYGDKYNSSYFKLLSSIISSNLMDNRHSSGKKFTKVVMETVDIEYAEKIVLLYSQVKNSYTVPNSYLVLSVDPYDFLTMGTGKGWKTCYKPNGGEHYTGTYSIALDNFSFVSYVVTSLEDLDSEKKYSEKIYRRMGVFTESYDGLTLSTQYPYKNEGFEKFTLKFIEDEVLNKKGNIVVRKGNENKVKTYKTVNSQVYNDFVSAPSNKKESLYIGVPREEGVSRFGSVFKCLSCGEFKALNDIPICANCDEERNERVHGK